MVEEEKQQPVPAQPAPNIVVINIPASLLGYQMTIAPPPQAAPAVTPPVATPQPASAPQPATMASAPEPAAPAYTAAPLPAAQPAPTPLPTASPLIIPGSSAFGGRKGEENEYATLFPPIRENLEKEFPTRGVARMLLKELRLGDGINATVDDVVRKAIFGADIHDPNTLEPLYLRPSDIPMEAVKQVRERTAATLAADGYKNHYQAVIGLTSNIEKYMAELISKGEIGLSFWTMRSATTGKKEGEKKGGLSPYDTLINAENIAFAGNLFYSLYQLGQQRDKEESPLHIIRRLVTNPYVDMEVGYLFGVGVGLPITADVIASGHPIDYVQEHFVKRIEDIFSIHHKEGETSALHEAAKAGQQIIMERYSDVAQRYGKAAHNLEEAIKNDAEHPLVHQLAKLANDEITVFGRTGGLAIRLIHGACMGQPVQTDLMARACVYHAAENAIKELYSGG